MKESNLQKQMKINLKERVNEELKALSNEVPDYDELSLKEKAMVEQYIEQIDLTNTETINNLGVETEEDIYKEINELLETIKKHDTTVENMFVEIMIKIDENTKLRKTEKSFIQQFRESPIAAFAKFKSTCKKTDVCDKRAEILANIDELKTKIEEIRNEAKENAKSLEKMAQKSERQYSNIQCQIIALEIVKDKIQSEQDKENKSEQKRFSKIEEKILLEGIEEKINGKIKECKNININIASRAIMLRILMQHNEKCVSKYDEELIVALPKLTQNILMLEANDSLTQDIEVCNALNEKLNVKSNNLKEDIIKEEKEVQNDTNEETIEAKVVTNNA